MVMVVLCSRKTGAIERVWKRWLVEYIGILHFAQDDSNGDGSSNGVVESGDDNAWK